MNGDTTAGDPVSARLHFLADVVMAEAKHLLLTDERLFTIPMTPERAQTLGSDIDLAERTDAFVGRFGRLQDTLADKLLPALLDASAEPVDTAELASTLTFAHDTVPVLDGAARAVAARVNSVG